MFTSCPRDEGGPSPPAWLERVAGFSPGSYVNLTVHGQVPGRVSCCSGNWAVAAQRCRPCACQRHCCREPVFPGGPGELLPPPRARAALCVRCCWDRTSNLNLMLKRLKFVTWVRAGLLGDARPHRVQAPGGAHAEKGRGSGEGVSHEGW